MRLISVALKRARTGTRVASAKRVRRTCLLASFVVRIRGTQALRRKPSLVQSVIAGPSGGKGRPTFKSGLQPFLSPWGLAASAAGFGFASLCPVQRSRLVELALRPEPRPKARRPPTRLHARGDEPRQTVFDLQGQHSL